jgi:hypothetical protein
MSLEPREPDLTPRQRWMAARRLAAGDQPVAAASAGVKTGCLQVLLDAGPEFQELVAALVELRAASREQGGRPQLGGDPALGVEKMPCRLSPLPRASVI